MMAETTEERKAAVLDALTMADTLTAALELAGVPESTYRHWRSTDAAFDAQVQALLTAPDPAVVPMTDQATQDALATLTRHVQALEARVSEMDALLMQARVLWAMITAVAADHRTMRALHLWAQRTVGQSRGPLPDLVQGLMPKQE
jgi:hypothetical protein